MKCLNCNSTFRVDDARAEFENHFDGIYYDSDQKGLCGDCAIDILDNWFSTMNREVGINQEDDDVYDDDYDGETLSVYDAAEIWASHGKDEDYTFGYSEEELENAL